MSEIVVVSNHDAIKVTPKLVTNMIIPCRYPDETLDSKSHEYTEKSHNLLNDIIRKILINKKITFRQFSDMVVKAVVDRHLNTNQIIYQRNNLIQLIFGKHNLIYDKFRFIMESVLNEEIPEDPKIIHFKNLGLGEDISGKSFNQLTAIECVGHILNTAAIYWRCLCECGNYVNVTIGHLKSGHTKSCGCYATEQRSIVHTKHGLRKHKNYPLWAKMLQRCYNQNNPKYHRYGGRGITVCDRWRESFKNFYADIGDKPEGMSIDRRDNDGNYEPSNCRWATPKEQSNNKHNNCKFDDDTSVNLWADDNNFNTDYVRELFHKGLTKEEILAKFKPLSFM